MTKIYVRFTALPPTVALKTGGHVGGKLKEAAERVRKAGRHGDDVLVHVNYEEFEKLRRAFGDPLINPETGIPEWGFMDSLKKVLRKVAPVLGVASLIPGLQFLSPLAMAGKGVAAATGLGATASNVVGGALLGGATGGKRGALTGGLGAFMSAPTASGESPLSKVGKFVLPGASEGTQSFVGRALTGAGSAAINDTDPLQGALTAATTGALADKLRTSDLVQNGLTDHRTLQQGALGAARGLELAGVTGGDAIRGAAAGAGLGAANAVLQQLAPSKFGYPTQQVTSVGENNEMNYGGVLSSAIAGSPDINALLGVVSGHKTKQEALAALEQKVGQHPDQRPVYDALTRFTMCDSSGDYGTCIAQNWDKLTKSISQNAPRLAEGGSVLDAVLGGGMPPEPVKNTYISGQDAGRVDGLGDGQSDHVDAKLSVDEYVFPADVVSAIGAGSSKAGAAMLDDVVAQIRAQYRSTPPTELPPPSSSPLMQLLGG